jgi:hypothetical protein
MHDLLAGAIALSGLSVVIAAARCGRLPRMYTGGIDVFDRPPRDQGGQQL